MNTSVLDRLVPDRPADAPSRRWIADHAWPANRDEAWRYAPLAGIVAATGNDGRGPVRSHGPEPMLDGPAGSQRVALIDGEYAPARSALSDSSRLVVETGGVAGGFRAGDRTDSFAALNHLASPATTRVRTAGRAETPTVVHLAHLTTAAAGAVHPRTEICAAPGDHLVVIETFQGAAGSCLTNATTMLRAGEHGRIDYVRLVCGVPGAAHVGRIEVVAGAGADVRCGTATLGPGAMRHTLAVDVEGTDTGVRLGGLAIPAPHAHHDVMVSLNHAAARGTSRQLFAAIVPDRARTSFTGHVLVAPGTPGIDADQQNRNLLLGPHARADARPWLEILADDVACTHGATVGRLDADGLFYARSRGIPERLARTMLITAFAESVLDAVTPPGVTRDWLSGWIASAIADLVAEPLQSQP